MGKFIDLTGQRFGRLSVVERKENNKHCNTMWLCQCDCGNEHIVCGSNLRRGDTKSCGCFQREQTSMANYQHGHNCNYNISKTYQTWQHIIQRCNNSNHTSYKNYGGRGINVCDRWLKFENFLEDMGERPPNLTIDRVDNNEDYCKENCKWSTNKEQKRNTRRNILVTINGITKCLKDWCKIYKLNYNTIRSRLRLGWTPKEALELVPRKKGKKNV